MKEDIEIKKYYSWKFIPLIFILSLAFELLIVLYVATTLPEYIFHFYFSILHSFLVL